VERGAVTTVVADGIFCTGRPLSPDELEMVRREIESFNDIGAVDDEIRATASIDPR
jgi:hypothetical protein